MSKNKNDFEKLIDPTKYQVFLFACPAFIPVQFAVHPWFVVNKKGSVKRWEIGHDLETTPNYFGYLRSDGLPFFEGLPILTYSLHYRWKGSHIRLLGMIEGDENSLACKAANFIEETRSQYPHRNTYRLTGPNSNTYIQWVLDRFPDWKIRLPWNAFGKNYDGK